MLAGQLLHRVQAAIDLRGIGQGLFDPAAQGAGAHGGGRLVQQPQQAALFAAAPDAFGQLQVAAGVPVQQHGAAALIDPQRGDVLHGVALGLCQVAHHGTGGAGARAVFLIQPQGRKVLQMKMSAQGLRGILILVPGGGLLRGRLRLMAQAGPQPHQIVGDHL